MATLTDDSELLEKMSPLLRGTVALETHRSWLSRVWYFADFVNRHATANGLALGRADAGADDAEVQMGARLQVRRVAAESAPRRGRAPRPPPRPLREDPAGHSAAVRLRRESLGVGLGLGLS